MHPELESPQDDIKDFQNFIEFLRDSMFDKPEFYNSDTIPFAVLALNVQLDTLTTQGLQLSDSRIYAFETETSEGYVPDKDISKYRCVVRYSEDGFELQGWDKPMLWYVQFWYENDLRPAQFVADVYGRMGEVKSYFNEKPEIDMSLSPPRIFNRIIGFFSNATEFPIRAIDPTQYGV
ncbi:hypothetical protein H0V99_03615 [Candidatus Saccharibacteria bacterium]|nr:hypothetical protein [Candidatus Saccharibacteria bacterium]